jgi:hypothetical protein
MPRISYVKIPRLTFTLPQIKERLAEARKRSRKSISLRTLGHPVLSAKASGGAATPAARKRTICIALTPFEWNLIFPEAPSAFGGIVCYRP